jgi:hypothetical protein
VALVGEDLGELAAVVRSRHRPHLVLAGGPGGADVPPLLASRRAIDGEARRLRLRELRLQAPVTEPQPARALLERMPPVSGSLFTFAAGRAAKWIVFAVWFLAIFIAAGRRTAEQVRRRRKQRGDLLPARLGRIDRGARRHREAAEGRNRAGGDRLPARLRPHRRRPQTIEEDVGKMTYKRFPASSPTAQRPPRAARRTAREGPR